ncbi:hypothetical protein HYH03_015554 [Edaphochlamys debaryana]|uniref:ArsA/GET3 Anion-transporting ATPase-like domain-containing protein n=1 Tax=Edaphochlamys debaryana TaxID=47281 RepID=A0A835XLQ1_9CHLO|nr:hypothetical protein HYH03_015554 [Edaphochlamys debaryana]|eukprot:KAG2485745.1 hypothetical protein HYH03_015554 [Edaphochlamys debaryana]
MALHARSGLGARTSSDAGRVDSSVALGRRAAPRSTPKPESFGATARLDHGLNLGAARSVQRPARAPSAGAWPHVSARRGPAPLAATPAGAPVAPVVGSATPFEELAAGQQRKYIMVSGKGGVGKTSLSASLAVRLAEAGHTTLVVSTDPAHSLGDSLAQDVSGGGPVLLQGTDLPLWGLEIDPEQAKREFLEGTGGANGADAGPSAAEQVGDFMNRVGFGFVVDQLKELKLGELLNTPPPGLDEAVAIAKVVQFVQSAEYARFSRIVFDTAPTGHTLRLLTLPDFVDASLAKVIRLRRKLNSATSVVRGLFGAGENQDELIEKLELLQQRVRMVKHLFRDASQTEFIIATIPTFLGVNESARLLRALRSEHIPCKRIIVNQLVGPGQGEAYLRLKMKDQIAALEMVAADPALKQLRKVIAPMVDLEVRGVPALSYFGNVVWTNVYDEMNAGADRKYFLLGGKGGVGKTSCSSSLAVKFASDGLPTLVVSTDPAHSISDAFDQDLSGGEPVKITSPLGNDLPLWGLQLDPEQAKQELREVLADDGGKKLNETLDSLGLGAVTEQLKDLQLGELLDTPPPGVDEAIAIAKVVQFLKAPEYAHFKRIVFDTAPTGHTLRLLSLPDFLDASIGKLVRLRQKLSSATSAVKSFFSGGQAAEVDVAVQRLEQLQARMEDAKALFRNQRTTEFIIVTIPTVMATAESCRLAAALQHEGIPLKTIIVNQVVQASATDKFLAARRADQARAMAHLKEDVGPDGLASLQLIQGPLCDLEVRGLPALQYFGGVVWK